MLLLNKKFLPVFICAIIFLSCGPQLHVAGNKVLNISFGKNNTITCYLSKGEYDVAFAGKKIISEAYAAYGPEKVKSSSFTFSNYTTHKLNDATGKGLLYTVEFVNSDGVKMQQLFYVYPDKDFFFVQLKVFGKNASFNYISPLTSNNAAIENEGDSRGLFVPYDNDMWVRYAAHPLSTANYTSSEVTALYNNDTYNGIVIGSIEHAVWKSGISIQQKNTNGLQLEVFGGFTDSVITHDKIPHGNVTQNDTVCSSPTFMIGAFADWRNGMEVYAAANLATEPPVIAAWKGATPMGWNSWGAIQTKLSLENAKQVVDFFADSCKAFRNADNTLFIDLDSYWDNLTGGMTGDFSKLTAFAKYCKLKGLQPGIYWAPFVDWGKSARRVESSTYNYNETWLLSKGKTIEIDGALAMDPTHPATKQRMAYLLNRFKECGFTMIKIDFLGHAAVEADKFYDPNVHTGMQAYSSGMHYLDSVLDNSMLVYAAISPNMATARYVHIRRIGCDAFSAIDNTEYTMNSTGYGWWQSHLYNYIDADHIVFGDQPAAANRARLASAIVTGTLITGDDFSKNATWNAAAQLLLQNKNLLAIIKDGKSFRPVEANTGNKGVEIFSKKAGKETLVAVFNYSNQPKDVNISAERIGLGKESAITATELFSNRKSNYTGKITLQLPANDAIILRITTP